jgi:hypothetical protein
VTSTFRDNDWLDKLIDDERRIERVFVTERDMIAMMTPVEVDGVTRVAVLNGVPEGCSILMVHRTPKGRGFSIIIQDFSLPIIPWGDRRVPQREIGIRFVEVRDRTEG